MSNSKPLPPFIFDLLCYLNRDQLKRFSIVCRLLKHFIDRYFHTKPYRVFDELKIREGSYVLFHKGVQWHPNRDDYSVEQFLANQKCSVDDFKHSAWNDPAFYSFAEMRPYLGPSVRINWTDIHVSGDFIYNIAEMESIAYLWNDGIINIFDTEDFQEILNSPTILQCGTLRLHDAHFSFKTYKVLYTVKVFYVLHYTHGIGIDPNYWLEFLSQPLVKPVVFLQEYGRKNVLNMIDCLSKAFSVAVSPNAFKIVFEYNCCDEDPVTEFQKMNKTSGEKLELKEGLPLECQAVDFDGEDTYKYTLERSSI
ncbi:hypothetical protein Ddc_24810 [Ditylenchus destructor]|nr:hypothetical protein Ddc_24810 [Ditylenchus destructor]